MGLVLPGAFAIGLAVVCIYLFWGLPLQYLHGQRKFEETHERVSLLTAIWRRECSREKDYNFGTRSVLQEFLTSPMSDLDYGSSTGVVYHDLTINMLNTFGSCEILQAAMACASRSGQPSWVVD